jgi:hypothetical protein
VTESDGKGLGWVAEKEFHGEAAADGVKEGGVGRGVLVPVPVLVLVLVLILVLALV